MGDIKAGVTLMQDFCRPKSEIFSGYIDYLDREEAQRNHAIQTFNLFNDYMLSLIHISEPTRPY